MNLEKYKKGILDSGFDYSKLTLRKVTDKFIKEHFSDLIQELNEVKVVKLKEPILTNFQEVPINKLVFGNKMKTNIWIGNLMKKLPHEYVVFKNTPSGLVCFNYDMETTKEEKKYTEKEMVTFLKNALKELIKEQKEKDKDSKDGKDGKDNKNEKSK